MKKNIPISSLVEGIQQGNRMMLARGITLIESEHPKDHQLALALLEALSANPLAKRESYRIGISGSPGSGKSSLIDVLGLALINQGHKVAVLSIDPSSIRSKGSILGDKTRMENLAFNDQAFVRPSPSAGTLGGIAKKTREAIFLCEAAGYDHILVETVGVGQSELTVHELVDCLVLLHLPHTGDQLQGIKRGIMEVADIIFVNKTDLLRKEVVSQQLADIRQAMHLLHMNHQWEIPVVPGSALTKNGIDELVAHLDAFQKKMRSQKNWSQKRRDQSIFWFHTLLGERLFANYLSNPQKKLLYERCLEQLEKGVLSPEKAVLLLLAEGEA